ncbi:DUF7484 family protein, partial [Pseudomonas aeruginosa]
MNAIQYALRDLPFRIPRQILESVFIGQEAASNAAICGEVISLETRIREAVLEPR